MNNMETEASSPALIIQWDGLFVSTFYDLMVFQLFIIKA